MPVLAAAARFGVPALPDPAAGAKWRLARLLLPRRPATLGRPPRPTALAKANPGAQVSRPAAGANQPLVQPVIILMAPRQADKKSKFGIPMV